MAPRIRALLPDWEHTERLRLVYGWMRPPFSAETCAASYTRSGWLGPFRGGSQNRAGRIRTRFCEPPFNKNGHVLLDWALGTLQRGLESPDMPHSSPSWRVARLLDRLELFCHLLWLLPRTRPLLLFPIPSEPATP